MPTQPKPKAKKCQYVMGPLDGLEDLVMERTQTLMIRLTDHDDNDLGRTALYKRVTPSRFEFQQYV